MLKINRISANISKEKLGKLILGDRYKEFKTKTKKTIHDKISSYKYFSTKGRETRLQTLLFNLLHFICDSNGDICLVKKIEMAKYLKCSLRTINRAIGVLVENNHIELGAINRGYLSCRIIDYEKQYAKKEDGGTGYLVMSLTEFESLAVLKGVNEVRLAIEGYIDVDYLKLSSNVPIYDTEALRNIIPSQVHSKGLAKFNDIKTEAFSFIVDKTSKIIRFIASDANSGKSIRKKETENANNGIIKEFGTYLSKPDKDDIISLSVQYGYKYVADVMISEFTDKEFFKATKNNIGAFIRNKINTSLMMA